MMKFEIGSRTARTLHLQIWAVALLACLAQGCRVEEPHGPLESEVRNNLVTDDLGRQVAIRQPVTRAVSLAPSVTEMIFAAGAGDRLVGVTSYCDYPEAAQAIEKVGDTQTPNIERIVAMKPDVVFVSTASQLETFFRTLERQKIAVYVVDPKGVTGVSEDLRKLGSIFNTLKTAETAASELERRSSAITSRERSDARPKVFVQISNEPLFTIGRDAFLAEIIARAGGELVTKEVPSAFPKLSKETASAMNPEVIILSDSDDNREPNAVFQSSSAVMNGRVYRMDPDIISRPGPRLVDALEQIAEHLRDRG